MRKRDLRMSDHAEARGIWEQERMASGEMTAPEAMERAAYWTRRLGYDDSNIGYALKKYARQKEEDPSFKRPVDDWPPK